MQLLTLVGNIGSDAKVVTSGGSSFISFNVANTETWTDQEGNKHESTNWVQCAYNGTHDRLLPFLKTGQKVAVIGSVHTRVYSSKKERKMVAGMNLNVMSIELIGAKADDVPSQLITSGGEIVDVQKYYYVDPNKHPNLTELFSPKNGSRYIVEQCCWVYPETTTKNENTTAQEAYVAEVQQAGTEEKVNDMNNE